ncbi:MAG TPA: AAA family ATPase [Thermoanaerobaculia bacterium]|nr:AAA family ATPase [Thermoanaerobaculia bacterium]
MAPRPRGSGTVVHEAMIELPYGIADFRRIRQQGMVYVDRTAYLRAIERLGSTLEHAGLFGDLEIGRQPTPLAHQYFVLQWNFSVVDPSGTVEQIAESLREHVSWPRRGSTTRTCAPTAASSPFSPAPAPEPR